MLLTVTVIILLYKHQWNNKWAFVWKLHIFTHENNIKLSSHMKRPLSLWNYIINHAFFTGVYKINKILHPKVDMNFIFSCSAPYLTCSLHSLVISSWTLEDKIHIYVWECNILYMYVLRYSGDSEMHAVVSCYFYDLYSSGKKQRFSSLSVTSIMNYATFWLSCFVSHVYVSLYN